MEIVNVLRQTLVAQRCVVAMEGAQIVEMTLIDRPVFFVYDSINQSNRILLFIHEIEKKLSHTYFVSSKHF